MKKVLLICLMLTGCERVEERAGWLVANCYTSTKQQFVEFELLPNDDEEMTRKQGLELLAESLSDGGEVWECE